MKRNIGLLFGLILSILYTGSLFSQEVSDRVNNDSYQRVYILDFGIGVGFPQLLGSGNSAWHAGEKSDHTIWAPSLQLMTYSPHSNIGYGVVYHNFNSNTKKCGDAFSYEFNEKTALNYVAPQISLIKRQLGFKDGIMYVNVGVGYAHYKSKGVIDDMNNYKISRSAIGCNLGIAYEYAFDSQFGLRLAANGVYARIKGLRKNISYSKEQPPIPRHNLHLFIPSVEIGLSYYMVRW